MTSVAAAEAEAIWKSFGRTKALQDVSVSVVPGECHALVGRNGAGKSTLVGVLTGLLKPDRGGVRLYGEQAPGLGDRAGWHLAIAGRGEEEGRLRAQSAAAGIDSRVHILGFRDDIPDILAAGDIFAMPSLSEGLPLALVEAMSFGLPVVVARVGGVPEVVTDDVEALLVPPSDAGALASALRRLIDDAELRRRLGDAGRTRAQRDFAIATMADRYERLYRGDPLS